MPPPVNQSNWVYGISDEPMANYTDDGTFPDDLVKFVTTDQQSAEISVNTQNNEGESTGVDWATEEDVTTHDVNIPFSINPTIKMLRRLLLAAFSQVATTSPNAGVSKDFYSPLDANVSRQLEAFWLAERCAAAHDALYPSCVLEKATFRGEESGKLNVSGNFRGSGQQILDEAVPIVAETGKEYLKFPGAKVIRSAAATPNTPVETVQCGLRSFMLDVDNAPDPNVGYDPGCGRFFVANDSDSGIIRSYHLFGRRRYTGQYIVWLANSSPQLALLRAKTPVYLKMGMYGKTIASTYKRMLEIEMHLAKYQSVVLGNQNGYTTLAITPNAFYDETTNKIVSVTVQYPTPS